MVRRNRTETLPVSTEAAANAAPFNSVRNRTMSTFPRSSPYYTQQQPILRGSTGWKITAGVVVLTLFCIARQEGSVFRSTLLIDEDGYRLFSSKSDTVALENPLHYCLDVDDPEWKTGVKAKICSCSNPLLPTKRVVSYWADHHKRAERQAFLASLQSLDLVMIGDNIIERWNGTRQNGREELPEYKRTFDRFFIPNRESESDTRLRAIALGSSGDTSNNILWHLQNGWLPSRLEPRAWLVSTGSNDLSTGCSKRTTLAGILRVANFIHERKPGVPIILQALLPRNDKDERETAVDYSLGQKWNQIKWLNRELKKFCELHPEWICLEVNNIFLHNVQNEGLDALAIDPVMMEDAFHPSAAAYQLWGEKIVEIFQNPPFQDSGNTEQNLTTR